MKLVEALRSIQTPPADARPLALQLACGFTPLHLQTFLIAHIQAFDPVRRVVVSSGLFGDCLGNLDRAGASEILPEVVVVVLEWADFDPRLGLRNVGGWRLSSLTDISKNVGAQVERFASTMERVAARVPLRISLPTLSLPPISSLPGGRSSSFDLELQARILELGARASRAPNVAVLNPQRLDRTSPVEQRRDVAAELASGFPYTLGHASILARAIAELVIPAVPKKGLITDLDDTLWRGLVGEVGAHGVNWDLDHKSHSHALYQQMLSSLADSGVLIAVASKNDAAVATHAFEVRAELAVLRDQLFPVDVSWGPKSAAVARILQAWNIGADSVVFVDDSPLELAEVRASWSDITCLRFPRESDAQVYALLEQLRDLFGKSSVTAEDKLRSHSLRQAQKFHEDSKAGGAGDANDFLAQLDAEVTLNYSIDPLDPRALELLNKTNQFNLNGRRYSEGDWLAYLNRPGVWLITVAYKDKFGPLGTIGVVAGHYDEVARSLSVDCWVLSCRAFSRRIEHACLRALFSRFAVAEIAFDHHQTQKNGPSRNFFHEVLGREPTVPFSMSRLAFETACPPLYCRLKELPHV